MSKRRSSRRSTKSEAELDLKEDVLSFKPGPLSPAEYKARMQACTRTQLASLEATPEFVAWKRSKHSPFAQIQHQAQQKLQQAQQHVQQLAQITRLQVVHTMSLTTAWATANRQLLTRVALALLTLVMVVGSSYSVYTYSKQYAATRKSTSSIVQMNPPPVSAPTPPPKPIEEVAVKQQPGGIKDEEFEAQKKIHDEQIAALRERIDEETKRAEGLAKELTTVQLAAKTATTETERLGKLLDAANKEAEKQKEALKQQEEAAALAITKAAHQASSKAAAGATVQQHKPWGLWPPAWGPGLPLLALEAFLVIAALSTLRSTKKARQSHLQAAAAHTAARENASKRLAEIVATEEQHRKQLLTKSSQKQARSVEEDEALQKQRQQEEQAKEKEREKERSEAAAWLAATRSLLGSLSPLGGSPTKGKKSLPNTEKLSSDPDAWTAFITAKLTSLKARASEAEKAASVATSAAEAARQDSSRAAERTQEAIMDQELLKEQLSKLKKEVDEAQDVAKEAIAKQSEVDAKLAETERLLETITMERTRLEEERTMLQTQLASATEHASKLQESADQANATLELEVGRRQRAEARVLTVEQELAGLGTLARSLESDKEDLETQLKSALDARAQALSTARRLAVAGQAVHAAAAGGVSESAPTTLSAKSEWTASLEELNALEGHSLTTTTTAAKYEHAAVDSEPASMPLYISSRLEGISKLLSGDSDASIPALHSLPAPSPRSLSDMPLSARVPMSARGLASARGPRTSRLMEGGGGNDNNSYNATGGALTGSSVSALLDRTAQLLNSFNNVESILREQIPDSSKDSSVASRSAPSTVRGTKSGLKVPPLALPPMSARPALGDASTTGSSALLSTDRGLTTTDTRHTGGGSAYNLRQPPYDEAMKNADNAERVEEAAKYTSEEVSQVLDALKQASLATDSFKNVDKMEELSVLISRLDKHQSAVAEAASKVKDRSRHVANVQARLKELAAQFNACQVEHEEAKQGAIAAQHIREAAEGAFEAAQNEEKRLEGALREAEKAKQEVLNAANKPGANQAEVLEARLKANDEYSRLTKERPAVNATFAAAIKNKNTANETFKDAFNRLNAAEDAEKAAKDAIHSIELEIPAANVERQAAQEELEQCQADLERTMASALKMVNRA